MDFGWTPEQLEGYREIVEFARAEASPDLAERDRAQSFDRAFWDKCARRGVLGWRMPVEYGGQARDVLTTVLWLEALGYGCRDNGFTLAVCGQMWAVQEPLLAFGNQAQKEKYLPRLISGEWVGAHGMTEEATGSDAFNLATRAEKVEGGYRLTGEKAYIGMAPLADLVLVFARTNERGGPFGVSAFLVESRSDGVTLGAPRSKMGLRTNPLGEVRLDGCFVPDENRLGAEGSGFALFQHTMDWERSFIFAGHLGRLARQLDETVEHARSRQVFGQPIAEFQAVSHRIADMKLRLEAARLLMYRAAWLKDQGASAALEAALTKLYVSEALAQSSFDALRIHGAHGYLSESGVERDLRDTAAGVIYSGTSDIQRNLIARLVLDGRDRR